MITEEHIAVACDVLEERGKEGHVEVIKFLKSKHLPQLVSLFNKIEQWDEQMIKRREIEHFLQLPLENSWLNLN